jgi:hypothetical protein
MSEALPSRISHAHVGSARARKGCKKKAEVQPALFCRPFFGFYERRLRSRQMPRPTRKKANPAAEATSTLMIFSSPSGCPSAETANERRTTVLNAARTAATATTPTLTTRLKHPERNLLLS